MDTIKERDIIFKYLKKYTNEIKYLHIHMQELRFTEQENNRYLLTITINQLNNSVYVNIYDRDLNCDKTNHSFKFRQNTFNQITNKLFNIEIFYK